MAYNLKSIKKQFKQTRGKRSANYTLQEGIRRNRKAYLIPFRGDIVQRRQLSRLFVQRIYKHLLM